MGVFHKVSGAAAAALILFGGCAVQGPPPGGPPDTTPPRVLWTVPAVDSVGVGLKTVIRIEFSERMDRNSVERAVFVSPRFPRTPAFKWHGRELEIRPHEALRPDRTYRVTVGAESADESGNRMTESYSVAFATGSRIDRGEIVGRVFLPAASRAVYVWAYDLRKGKDPDPATEPPAYVTQPGKDGAYRFPWLGAGRYRIFAFEDQNRDQAFTPGIEPLAVPPADVVLASDTDRVRLGPLRMAVRDTIPPRLVSVRTPDARHLVLRFDEPVSVSGRVSVSGPGGPLKVEAAFTDPADSMQVRVLTARQRSGATYRIDSLDVVDRAGNPAAAASGEAAQVSGEGTPDRRPPEIVRVVPAPDAQDVEANADLWIEFNEAMTPSIPEAFWVSSDSTVAPKGRFSWVAPNRLRFAPASPWTPGQTYRLLGRAEQLSDASGNASADSAAFRFQVLGKEDLGILEGTRMPTGTPAVVEARRLKPPDRIYRTRVAAADSSYVLKGLLPGSYRVTAFLDRDGNGVWTPGTVRPFSPSEPMAEPDTLEVRARWTNEAERPLRLEARELLSPGKE